jgi:hypothetical protein
MVLLLDFPKCDDFQIHLDFVILYGFTEGKINDMIWYDMTRRGKMKFRKLVLVNARKLFQHINTDKFLSVISM